MRKIVSFKLFIYLFTYLFIYLFIYLLNLFYEGGPVSTCTSTNLPRGPQPKYQQSIAKHKNN